MTVVIGLRPRQGLTLLVHWFPLDFPSPFVSIMCILSTEAKTFDIILDIIIPHVPQTSAPPSSWFYQPPTSRVLLLSMSKPSRPDWLVQITLRFWSLHFIGAKDGGSGGDNWSIRSSKLLSNRHHQQANTKSFTGRRSFLSPNQQRQALMGMLLLQNCYH